MKLIVGLGNPGKVYEKTRHNIGFFLIDKLVEILISLEPIDQNLRKDFENKAKFKAEVLRFKDNIFIKPQTFMNESGLAVLKTASFYKIESKDIYVIHDDLDIKLGGYKIQRGVGPKLHYGIRSIEKKLKDKNFWRVRIGVDNRSSTSRISGEEYVLEKFSVKEQVIINRVIDNLAKSLVKIVL